MLGQIHEPEGATGLSGLIDIKDLGIFAASVPLDHRHYHFRLLSFGLDHAHGILGGERCIALAEGLHSLLWLLGAGPCEPCSAGLCAAFRNLDVAAGHVTALTRR